MNFSGLVKIHITVDPENDFIKLWQFTQDNDCKLILACVKTGTHPNQYMISKFTNKDSFTAMMDKLKSLEYKMKEYGLKIIRSKIELMMSAEGIPKTHEEYEQVCKILEKPYFEFHVKTSSKDYTKLSKECSFFAGVGVSVNICGKDKDILLTIRCYTGKQKAIEYKNVVLDYFKDIGHKFKDQIQEEFCIYDDNKELDGNWIE
jgi:hypothetical protein